MRRKRLSSFAGVIGTLAGVLAGIGHWLTKVPVVVGTCVPHLFCPAGEVPQHLVRPPIGADDVLIGLATAFAAFILIEVALLWATRSTRRTR